MIRSFRDGSTEELFHQQSSKAFRSVAKVAFRRLIHLHRAKALQDLALPGNHLQALKGDRKGQYSIRINDQYRICFRWESDDAADVEIVDYH